MNAFLPVFFMPFSLGNGDVFLEEDGEAGSFNFCVTPEVHLILPNLCFFSFLAKSSILTLPNTLKDVGNPPEGPTLDIFMAESVSLDSCFVSVDGNIDDLRDEALDWFPFDFSYRCQPSIWASCR